MKNILALLILTLFLSFSVSVTNGQALPIDLQCNGRDMHSLYIAVPGTGYYRIDSADTHPTAPIFVALDSIYSIGISINKNIDLKNSVTTMYAVNGSGEYYYWSGTRWVNTNHTSGDGAAVNPGGTDQYIFNLDGGSGGVYRYDGTGNGTQIISGLNTSGIAIYDIAADKNGNFYIFFTAANKIVAYNPNGVPIDSFTTTGNQHTVAPGFVILGTKMYMLDNTPALYEGIITGHTVNFTVIESLPLMDYEDLASCPEAGDQLAVFRVPDAPHFIIYPNPATDKAVIKMDNTNVIDITDCTGRKVASIDTRGLTQYYLQLSDYAHGVYFVTATSANGLVAHTTLVVQ